MISCLPFVAVLLALLTVYLPEPCSCSITAEFNDTNCPEPLEDTECRRGMLSSTQYVKLYSKKFNTKYLCDTRTDGGGWVVFLRRVHKDTSFNQLWSLYKNGFGSVCSDYWLGNKYVNLIADSDKYELRVDMTYKNKEYYAYYKYFEVGDEASNYSLHIDGYTGDAGDNLVNHDHMKFSTPDRDNDARPQSSCAQKYSTGWWFHSCRTSLLTGDFHRSKSNATGVIWPLITGDYESLDMVEMKIRQRKP
ncbi:Ficolin-1-B [Bulinus truncatus]|nr:Ficolin-1-B [Bulinus truncatus]